MVTPIFMSAVPNRAFTSLPTATRRVPFEENMKSPVTDTVSASENLSVFAAISKYSPLLPLLSKVARILLELSLRVNGEESVATVVLPAPSPWLISKLSDPELTESGPRLTKDAAPEAPMEPLVISQLLASPASTGVNSTKPKSTSVMLIPAPSTGLPNSRSRSRPPTVIRVVCTLLSLLSVRESAVGCSAKVNEPPSLKESPSAMLPESVTDAGAWSAR